MSEFNSYGFQPTLFPRTKVEEDQITSIFFAVLEIVQPLRDTLFKSINKTAYKNGKDFEVFLHPSFGGKYSAKDVPDAYIALNQKHSWRALVEVKIRTADLTPNQLENYLERARDNGFDALITISNELCSTPLFPPLRLKTSNKRLQK